MSEILLEAESKCIKTHNGTDWSIATSTVLFLAEDQTDYLYKQTPTLNKM
jgi:hypothetical protein